MGQPALILTRTSNFHDRQRMDQRSIYGLYSTITLGVQGTAMASFRTLSEDERWALASTSALSQMTWLIWHVVPSYGSLALIRPGLPISPASQQRRPVRYAPRMATMVCGCLPTCAASPRSSCR